MPCNAGGGMSSFVCSALSLFLQVATEHTAVFKVGSTARNGLHSPRPIAAVFSPLMLPMALSFPCILMSSFCPIAFHAFREPWRWVCSLIPVSNEMSSPLWILTLNVVRQVRENNGNGRVLARYCGSAVPNPIFSTTSTVWVQYFTKGTPSRGYDITYTTTSNGMNTFDSLFCLEMELALDE